MEDGGLTGICASGMCEPGDGWCERARVFWAVEDRAEKEPDWAGLEANLMYQNVTTGS